MDSNNNEEIKDQSKQSFNEIRNKALVALTAIISQIDNSDPQRKFNAAMTALKYGVSVELAKVALDAALAMQDVQIQSDMLLQLLSEISYLEDSIK